MSGSSSTAEGAFVESGLFTGFACSPPSDEPVEADALAESWDGASELVSTLDSGVFDGQVEDVSNQQALRNQKTRQGPQNPQKQFYPSCASPPEARTRVIGMHTRASRATFSANAAHSSLSCDVISALKQLKGSISPGKVSEKARKTPSRQVFTSHETPEYAEKSKNVARTLRVCSQN